METFIESTAAGRRRRTIGFFALTLILFATALEKISGDGHFDSWCSVRWIDGIITRWFVGIRRSRCRRWSGCWWLLRRTRLSRLCRPQRSLYRSPVDHATAENLAPFFGCCFGDLADV